MNQAINFKQALAELKLNESVGLPPTNNFSELCRYVTNYMIGRYDLKGANSINRGYCFIWCYLVWALWPRGGVTFRTTTGHVVVMHGNRYYDSKHVRGTTTLLNYCSFSDGYDSKPIDVKWMCWYWARTGYELSKFRALIRKMSPKLYTEVRDGGKKFWKNHWDFYSYLEFKNVPELKA